MHYDDDEVTQAIIAAKERFYRTVQDAYKGGLAGNRIIGLVGFSNARKILGADAIEPWNFQTTAAKPKPAAPRVPGVTPAAMPPRRSENT